MRVLIIKTSSMGDVVHTLPALTDAARQVPGIIFDWVVEENFSEIPGWHSHVDQVIPIAWRRWRKHIFSPQTWREWYRFRKQISAKKYDVVIDAQGLVKSAFFAKLASGLRVGLDGHSARESLASLFYQKKCFVERDQHAITRTRQLFGRALDYSVPTTVPDYGIDRSLLTSTTMQERPYLVFLHGTTWDTKHWPEEYWVVLANLANQHGLQVKLPWGSATEKARAERIAAKATDAVVLPKLALRQMVSVLADAQAVVAVDTGLAHLAAALNVPTVSLYGPTDPARSGALGKSQIHLVVNYACAPCFGKSCALKEDNAPAFQWPMTAKCFHSISPERVWTALTAVV